MAPLSSLAPPMRPGLLFHVMPPVPLSIQSLDVLKIAGPLEVPLVANNRSLALVTGPSRPAIWKRRKVSTSGPASFRRLVEVPKFVEGLASSTRASASTSKASVRGSDSESSAAEVQPASFEAPVPKSILPSESLSIASEHCVIGVVESSV
jgi:hypothetical protein